MCQVTRFDMTTFEVMDVWDGKCIYPKAATDEIISAFVNFVKGITEKPDGHVGILWTATPEVDDIFAMAPLTGFGGEENPECLKEFMDIQGQKDMKRTTISKELASFRLPSGKQYVCSQLTPSPSIKFLRCTSLLTQ